MSHTMGLLIWGRSATSHKRSGRPTWMIGKSAPMRSVASAVASAMRETPPRQGTPVKRKMAETRAPP